MAASQQNRVRIEFTIPIEFGTWDSLLSVVPYGILGKSGALGRALAKHILKEDAHVSTTGMGGLTFNSEARAEITRIDGREV